MGNQFSKKLVKSSWILGMALVALVVFSCNDSFGPAEPRSPQISASNNAEIVMASQEVMDITGAGMSNQGISYGRAAAHEGDGDYEDHMLCGAKVTKNFSLDNSMQDSLILSGSISIDFGDGTNCSDSSRHHSGKITTEFTINVNLKNHLYTSSETITMENFTKGSKILSGVFHAQAASGGKSWLDITNAQLTYTPGDHDDDEGEDDGDEESDDMNSTPITITWSGNLTFTYDNNGTLTRGDDVKTVTGSISGTTENGTFTTEIVEAVTFKMACFSGRNIPVKGIVNVTSADVLTVLDFGDGSCDKMYTSTTAGETTEMEL